MGNRQFTNFLQNLQIVKLTIALYTTLKAFGTLSAFVKGKTKHTLS